MTTTANTTNTDKKICIVGSGLVGTLLAILLAEAGFIVDVYEKRPDPQKDFQTRGRSIALSLSERGWEALRRVGLDALVRENTNPAYGRVTHQSNGATHSQDYGDGTQATWTVNRNFLNVALLKRAAATKHAAFFFEHSFEEFDLATSEVVLTDTATKQTVRKHYDHVIGVDGVFSAVRKNLSEKGIWKFQSSTLEFGYKELYIPPDANGQHTLENHRVHIWHGKNSVLIAFPTNDGDFTSTLFLPLTGKDSLASITTPELLMSFFKREYANVIPLMPNLEQDFFQNANSTLTQIQGGPWHYKDKVLLMGDAAHAITPFYGMGMNIGLEDCMVFMDLLEKSRFDFAKTFASLEKVRKPNTDAMGDLSYKNFMSISQSPDPTYQEKWLLERRIWQLLPHLWTPVYVLIAFSNTPLAEVPLIKDKQDRVLNELVAAYPDAMQFSDKQFETTIDALYRTFERD
jgi:kynurenine 3-monooxygenase